MATLPPDEIAALLTPYLAAPPSAHLLNQLSLYLDLLLKWNARTNLTAIRDPAEIVRRHFGESLFAARHLPPCNTLLDFGSGAGFPGIPIALLRPEIHVTLAESQNKKVAFLREALRTLDLSAEIWPDRVQSIPPERHFDCVTLRAVDNPAISLPAAVVRAEHTIALLTTSATFADIASLLTPFTPLQATLPIPGSSDGLFVRLTRPDCANPKS